MKCYTCNQNIRQTEHLKVQAKFEAIQEDKKQLKHIQKTLGLIHCIGGTAVTCLNCFRQGVNIYKRRKTYKKTNPLEVAPAEYIKEHGVTLSNEGRGSIDLLNASTAGNKN